MNKLLKQAFTLIELLVVIAIVGILSGLIIVGINGMTQKATIAKSQVFSNSLRNSLMMNLVSEWKFDQTNVPSTDQSPDSWSGGNTCTLKQYNYAGVCDSTHCPQLQATGCISDNCLSFDGADDYVNCGSGANLDITNAITIEAWIKPAILFSSFGGVIVNRGYSNWYFALEGTRLFWGEQGWQGDANGRIRSDAISYSVNNWYHVLVTYNRTTKSADFYFNGIAVGLNKQSVNQADIANTGNVYIGQNASVFPLNGLIDNVRIYNAAIPTSQIKEQYYAGLNKLFVKKAISEENYQNEIKKLITAKI